MNRKGPIWITILLSVLLTAATGSAQTKKIMLLGDSNTEGIRGSVPVGGFRDDLYNLLVAAGVDFDFVGSLADGNSANFDVDHEGVPGFRADQIDDIVTARLNTYLPDIVVLHIGTNDISNGDPNSGTNGTIGEIASIVDKINSFDSDIVIILSSLIPRDDADDAINDNLNSLIEDLYYTKQSAGYAIYYAGANEVFKANPDFALDYLDDTVHPNNDGYALIAQVFFNAILNVCNEERVLSQYFSDNFNRSSLGSTWFTDNGLVVSGNQLSNVSGVGDWNLAMYLAQENPSRVAFTWADNADQTGMEEGGFALKLNQANSIATVRGYLLWIGVSNKVRLVKILNGEPSDLIEIKDSNQAFPNPGDRVEVRMISDETSHHFDLYVNDVFNLRLSHNDKTFITAQRQYAGVMLRDGVNNDLDDFYLFKQGDTTPPATITDLSATDVFASSISAEWTAPGDDGSTGLASLYEMRISEASINEGNFANATLISTSPPRSAGSTENLNISGLSPNTTYYIVIKTFDESGNGSSLSSNLVITTLQSLTYVDTFNRPDLGPDWVAHPDISIVNGELSNAATNPDWKDPGGTGYLAIYTGRVSPSEVSFKYGAASQSSDIENVALAIMMDDQTLTANGYMIWFRPSKDQIYCFQLVNGNPGPLVGTGPISAPDAVAGDVFKVRITSDATGNHFEGLVNGVSYGTVTDPSKHVDPDLVSDLYSGALLHGLRDNNVDDFTVLSEPGDPDKLVLISGDFQEGTVGTELLNPLVVRVTDNKGNPVGNVQVEFDVLSGGGSLDKSEENDGNIRIEAENGSLESPMEAIVDSAASGNRYVTTSVQKQGQIDINFTVQTAANYYIWGRIYAENGEQNSFRILMDGETDTTIWDIAEGSFGQWRWELIEDRNTGVEVYNLASGPHVLHVHARERLSRIDKVLITSDGNYIPDGLEPVSGYVTNGNGDATAMLTLGTIAGPNTVRASASILPGKEVIFTETGLADAPITMEEISGNNQTGGAGELLPNPFIVKLSDRYDNPVEGAPVSFEVTEGQGSITEAQPVLTDGGGFASVTFTLDDMLANNTVRASHLNTTPTSIDFHATATSGVPSNIVRVSGHQQTGPAGAELAQPLVVKVTDPENTPMPGVQVTFTTTPGNGSFVENQPVATDANGEARASWVLGTQAGQQQVTAVVTGLTGSPVPFTATAEAGAAANLVKVSGDSASGVVNQTLGEAFVVEVTDQHGNKVPSVPIAFSVLEGGGHFANGEQNITISTDQSGRSSAFLVLGLLAGDLNNRVAATKAGLSGSPQIFLASAVAGGAAKIVMASGNDQPAGFVRQPLAEDFVVKVMDEQNNAIAGHQVEFAVQQGGGTLNNEISTRVFVTSDADGFAMARLWPGPVAGDKNNVVHAIAINGQNPLTNSPIVFEASAKYAGTQIAIIGGNNQSGVVTSVLPTVLEVQVLDVNDAPVANMPVTFDVISGGGTLDLADTNQVVKQTDDQGKADVILTIGPSVGQDINVVHATATDGFDALSGSPGIFVATGVASNASKMAVSAGDGQTGPAGEMLPTNIGVFVSDSLDNPVADHPVTFKITDGQGYFEIQTGNILAEDTVRTKMVNTDVNGLAEVSWILGTEAGPNNNRVEVSASDGVNPLENSPSVFTASADPGPTDPDLSIVTATGPTNADGNAVSNISITLLDRFGNPISGKLVSIAASGSQNFINQPAGATNANGQASGSMASIAAGTKIITVTNTSDNIQLNAAVEAVFVPGTPDRLVRSAGNEQTRNIGTFLKDPLQVLVTDNFNNPVSGVPVFFEVKSGGGQIPESQPVVTDANGHAEVRFSLGEIPGENFVEARSGSLIGSPVLFSATGVNNPASTLTYVSGDAQSGTAGEPLALPLVVKALDANNDPVKNFPITFATVFGGGSVTPPQPTTTNPFGEASTIFTLGPSTGQHIVSAVGDGLDGSPITFFASAANAVAKKIVHLSGDNQSGVVQSSGSALRVSVRDNFDNVVSGYPVNFEVISGGVTITSGQPSVSDGNGVAQASFTHGTTSGVSVIHATAASLAGSPVVFEVNTQPGPAAAFTLESGNNQTGTVDKMLLNPLTSKVVDQFGNPVSGHQVTYVKTQGDAVIQGSGTVNTGADGLAHVTLQLGPTPGNVQILAVASDISGAFVTFDVTSVQNDVPSIVVQVQSETVDENQNISFDVTGSDPDNDDLTFQMMNQPAGSNFTSGATNVYTFSWTPSYDQSGSYDIVFEVLDTKGGVARDTVTISVTDINRKPLIIFSLPTQVDTVIIQGESVAFSITASDPDGDQVQYFWTKNGQNVAAGPVYNYFSPPGFTGFDEILVFVSDGKEAISKRWTISVITTVELEFFTAAVAQSGQAVELSWRTTSEQNNLGFNVYRSLTRDGSYGQINDDMLPANGSGFYTYTDAAVMPGQTYYYKIEDISVDGIKALHGPTQAEVNVPEEFVLEQNYPNPFNPETTIRFQLPQSNQVRLSIFNILGQEVRVLVDRKMEMGFHSFVWDGKDNNGLLVTTGIYYYRIQAGNYSDLRKMLLMK